MGDEREDRHRRSDVQPEHQWIRGVGPHVDPVDQCRDEHTDRPEVDGPPDPLPNPILHVDTEHEDHHSVEAIAPNAMGSMSCSFRRGDNLLDGGSTSPRGRFDLGSR
jgi:hypothetical protein